jgi:hypothetical protein
VVVPFVAVLVPWFTEDYDIAYTQLKDLCSFTYTFLKYELPFFKLLPQLLQWPIVIVVLYPMAAFNLTVSEFPTVLTIALF